MNKKRILTVGEYDFHRVVESLNDESTRLVFEDYADDLTDFMEYLNDKDYFGVLFQSLALNGGKDAPKYHEQSEKFSGFDSKSGFIWYSTGLFAVEQSVKKGLVCVVYGNIDDKNILNQAEKLGARVMPPSISANINNIYRAFLQ